MSATERIHAFFCGLGGHDLMMHVEPARLSLKCTSCQYETPGWQVKAKSERHGDGSSPRPRVLMPHNIHG